MISAVKENALKLFCESKINRLINVLSARDGLWTRSTATKRVFCLSVRMDGTQRDNR